MGTEKISHNCVRHRLTKIGKRAGIPYGDGPRNAKGERTGFVFHCFRHTRISRWVAMGFSDELIRRASGHQNLEAYRKYIHLDPQHVMRLVADSKPVIVRLSAVAGGAK